MFLQYTDNDIKKYVDEYNEVMGTALPNSFWTYCYYVIPRWLFNSIGINDNLQQPVYLSLKSTRNVNVLFPNYFFLDEYTHENLSKTFQDLKYMLT
jgi:hypothetical protein